VEKNAEKLMELRDRAMTDYKVTAAENSELRMVFEIEFYANRLMRVTIALKNMNICRCSDQYERNVVFLTMGGYW